MAQWDDAFCVGEKTINQYDGGDKGVKGLAGTQRLTAPRENWPPPYGRTESLVGGVIISPGSQRHADAC